MVGLLTSKKLPEDKSVYYGIIADGIHTHAAALRIAFYSNPKGIIFPLIITFFKCFFYLVILNFITKYLLFSLYNDFKQ